jgi:hypothetical protein
MSRNEARHQDHEGVYREAARAALALRAAGADHDLADLLYGSWYAATAEGEASLPDSFPADLVAVLRAVHAGRELWENGWIVTRVGPGAMVEVSKGREHRVLYRSDYVVPERPGLQARPGDNVCATSRRDQVDLDGGWWRTRGAAWSDTKPPDDLVRLYWGIRFAELPRLVSLVTELLDGVEEPWLLKCAVQPAVHLRPDSAVLYLPRICCQNLSQKIEAVRAQVEAAARAATPPFTLVVGPGLAVSEDPGGGESFGQHRCRLVAEAVLGAEPRLSSAAAAVIKRFQADGIDPRRPYARGSRRLPMEQTL